MSARPTISQPAGKASVHVHPETVAPGNATATGPRWLGNQFDRGNAEGRKGEAITHTISQPVSAIGENRNLPLNSKAERAAALGN